MRETYPPGERLSQKRSGRFLVAVVKGFTLWFVVAAVLSPADPLAFLLYLVPGWLAAVPIAYSLVYRESGELLRESGLYRPGALARRRTVLWFVGTVVGLKLLVAVVDAAVLPPGTLGRPEHLALSLLALACGYLLVFRGWYDRLGVIR